MGIINYRKLKSITYWTQIVLSFGVLYLVPNEYKNSMAVETILIVLIWGYIKDYSIENIINRIKVGIIKMVIIKKKSK